jgi:hypothetical protein
MTASLREVQAAMVQGIAAPGGEGIYRTLVRRGLADILRFMLPRTAAHLGAIWDREVARFLDEALPRSPYLRDAAFEFVARAAPRWAEDPEAPPHIVDLARFELLGFEVTNAPDDPPIEAPAPLALDRRVALSSAARFVRFRFAVHALPEDESSLDPPAAEPVALCMYRDAEHDNRTLALTPSAAEIFSRLLAGATLGEAVSGAAEACGAALDEPFLRGAASLLEDFTARGIVRGAA